MQLKVFRLEIPLSNYLISKAINLFSKKTLIWILKKINCNDLLLKRNHELWRKKLTDKWFFEAEYEKLEIPS